MGWDVDAIYDGEPFNYVKVETDAVAATAFHHASEEAHSVGGDVDPTLEYGRLDIGGCVHILAEYAGESNRFAVWTVAQVREYQETIVWPELTSLPQPERWMVASARAFLRACATQGYGIQFDP